MGQLLKTTLYFQNAQGRRSNSRAGGGKSLEKGTCTYYDVIITSECKPTGTGGFRNWVPGAEIIYRTFV